MAVKPVGVLRGYDGEKMREACAQKGWQVSRFANGWPVVSNVGLTSKDYEEIRQWARLIRDGRKVTVKPIMGGGAPENEPKPKKRGRGRRRRIDTEGAD